MPGFTEETRFVTRSGIKSFSRFKEGDTVEIISHDKQTRKARIVKVGVKKVYRVTLHCLSRGYKSIDTTLEQGWMSYSRNRVKAKINDILFPLSDSWKVYNVEEYKEMELWSLKIDGDATFILEGNIVVYGC